MKPKAKSCLEPPEAGGGRDDPLLESLEVVVPSCQQLDFFGAGVLVVSVIVRIIFALRPQLVVILWQS